MPLMYSRERKIEDAVVGLLASRDNILTLRASVKRSYDESKDAQKLSVVVRCMPAQNENAGATGGGKLFRAALMLLPISNIASDRPGNIADQLHGECQAFLGALTPATLNTTLSGITVYGIIGTDVPEDEILQDRGLMQLAAAVELRFEEN